MKLRRMVPAKLRRIYRRFVSPLVRDRHFHERKWRADYFRRAFCALGFNGISGDYVEFGSCGGMTFELAHRESRRSRVQCHLWAFDSFKGLPEQSASADAHPAWVAGSMSITESTFHKVCREVGIRRSDYDTVAGYFCDSLAGEGSFPRDICMAYIDCDLYSSTVEVLKFLLPRLKHGMVLAFDDFYCWSSSQASGERRACAEMFRSDAVWRLVPFIQFGWGGMSFVVESRSHRAECGEACGL